MNRAAARRLEARHQDFMPARQLMRIARTHDRPIREIAEIIHAATPSLSYKRWEVLIREKCAERGIKPEAGAITRVIVELTAAAGRDRE